jgi:hypothetical protein
MRNQIYLRRKPHLLLPQSTLESPVKSPRNKRMLSPT